MSGTSAVSSAALPNASLAQSQAAPEDTVLDLDNSADRALVNERLSWMAQAFHSYSRAIDLNDPDIKARFAIEYLGVSDLANWESVDNSADYTKPNERVAETTVADITEDFFDRPFDGSELSSYDYEDGYVYFKVTAPPTQIAAYSAASEAEALGDDRFRVSFELFYDDTYYTEHDGSFFALNPEEMSDELGKVNATKSGEATMRVIGSGSDKRLVIEEYSIEESADSTSDPEDSLAADDGFAARYVELNEQRLSDRRTGGSTKEMNEAGAYYTEQFGNLIDDIIEYMKAQAGADANAIQEEQDAWEESMEERAHAEAAEMHGGTYTGPVYSGTKMTLQRERIVELLEALGTPVDSSDLPAGLEDSEPASQTEVGSADSAEEDATASYYGAGFNADVSIRLNSITFEGNKVTIVGPLTKRQEDRSKDFAIDKTWVFTIDENTKYGYGNDTGFHEQPLAEVEEQLSELRFPGINIEAEDGVVTMMCMSS